MADIVNGGVIILVAAFGLVAIVGAADQFRQMAGPGSGPDEPDAVASSSDAEPSTDLDVDEGIAGKRLPDDDRGDKHDNHGNGDKGDRGRDRDERHHDNENEDGDDEEEEDDD